MATSLAKHVSLLLVVLVSLDAWQAVVGQKPPKMTADMEKKIKDKMAAGNTAMTAGADKMKTCMNGKATAAKVKMAAATALQRKDWGKACDTEAKAAFTTGGGSAKDWEASKKEGAKDKGADKMKTCVTAAATAAKKDMKTATAAEKKGFMSACEAGAKSEFEASGGTAEEWRVAKQEGARDKGADSMKTCVETAAVGKDMKTATAAEKKGWLSSCEADAKAAFETSGGSAEEWKVAKKEGARDKGAGEMKACVDTAATAAGKDMKTATEAEKKVYFTSCDAVAKAAFEASGGSADEWMVAKKEGARGKGTDQMKACVDAAVTAAVKDIKTATETEKKAWFASCEVEAKAAFESSGGSSKEWMLAKKEGARDKGADQMKGCVDAAVTAASKDIKTATETEKKAWFSSCDTEAKAAFESSGGTAKEWLSAKKQGARDKGTDDMKACVDTAVTAAGKDMKTATEAEKKAWFSSCEVEAKAAFESSGGSSKEWMLAKKEGARGKGSDQMKACVDAAVTAAGKDMKTATEVEKKGWFTSCEAEAKAAFETSGGSEAEWVVAKKEGARGKGTDQMQTCVDAAVTAASKDIKTATATEKTAWVSTCEADAKAAFESAGGSGKEWMVAKKAGARSKGADEMKTCVDAAVTAAGKDIKTATEAEKKVWFTSCQAGAKAAFEASGGSAKEWNQAKKEGARDKGADEMKACVDTAVTAASKDMKTATDAEKKGWFASCNAGAKAAFEASGGSQQEWEAAKAEGARSKGADKMKGCVEAKATTAGKAVSTATATETKGWAKLCSTDAKADFEAAGGRKNDWNDARQNGAENKGAEAMKACFEDKIATASKTMATATDAEKLAARTACDAIAKENFKASGGAGDWQVAKRKGAESKAVSQMKACTTALAETAGKTWTAATEVEKKSWNDNCKDQAKEEFEAAGGKVKDFLEAREKGAAKAGGDRLKTCMASKAEAGSVSAPTEAQTKTWRGECDAEVKAEFEASGGDPKVFKAAMAESRVAKMATARASCMSDCGDTDACKTTCEAEMMEHLKQMGGKVKKFAKDKQSGARGEAALVMKACKEEGGTTTDCKVKAKASFLAGGGTEAQLAGETRRGAGDLAAKSLKVCVKEAAANNTAAGLCLAVACTVLENTGGDVKDCWLDRKQALLRWTLQHCSEATCTAAQAKAYAKDTLLAEESDWSDADWANMVGLTDDATVTAASADLDAKFLLGKAGETSATLKLKIIANIATYLAAAKDALGAANATSNGVDDKMSELEATFAARLSFATIDAALAAETKLRAGVADTAVAAAFSRRLRAEARLLSAISSSEGSRVVSESVATITSGGGGGGGGGGTTTTAGAGVDGTTSGAITSSTPYFTSCAGLSTCPTLIFFLALKLATAW